jgi:hypothetical protein
MRVEVIIALSIKSMVVEEVLCNVMYSCQCF